MGIAEMRRVVEGCKESAGTHRRLDAILMADLVGYSRPMGRTCEQSP